MHILGDDYSLSYFFFVVYFALTIVGARLRKYSDHDGFRDCRVDRRLADVRDHRDAPDHDARIRDEGLDIELMEVSLGDSAPVATSDYDDRSARRERSEGL